MTKGDKGDGAKWQFFNVSIVTDIFDKLFLY